MLIVVLVVEESFRVAVVVFFGEVVLKVVSKVLGFVVVGGLRVILGWQQLSHCLITVHTASLI